MFKFFFALSLFATPLSAEELKTSIPTRAEQLLIESLQKQLADTTDHWMIMNDSERLALAFAAIAKQPEFRAALNLTDETFNGLKTAQIAVSPELGQQISSLALFEFTKHLKMYRHQLQIVSPNGNVALKVGVELMKGITAINVAMLSGWIGFSGVPIDSADILLSMKVLSSMSAMYAAYRPVAVLNIFRRNREDEKLRLGKIEKLIAVTPIPEKLWHNWFLIQVFGSKSAADTCHSLLSEQIN